MGIVITVNGRMGATVSCVLQGAELGLLGIASHSVPSSRTHAIWLLLQLLRRRVPLRPRHRLAWVSLSDQPFHHFRRLTIYSVQTTTGGQCMSVLLTAIWPSFANIPNHIPASEGITTSGMCGFVLYFLLQLPFLCIPYTKVWPCSQNPPSPPLPARFMDPTNTPRSNTSSLSRVLLHQSFSSPFSVPRCTRLAAPSVIVRSSAKAPL